MEVQYGTVERFLSQAQRTNPTALTVQSYREEKRLACRVLLSVYLLAGELAE